MAALAAAKSVVDGQQHYAKERDLSALFEVLLVNLLAHKPADILASLHAHLEELAGRADGSFSLPAVRQPASAEKDSAPARGVRFATLCCA